MIHFNASFYSLWKYFLERSANLIISITLDTWVSIFFLTIIGVKKREFKKKFVSSQREVKYSKILQIKRKRKKSRKESSIDRNSPIEFANFPAFTIDRTTSWSIIPARNGIHGGGGGCLIDAGKKWRIDQCKRWAHRFSGQKKTLGGSPPRRVSIKAGTRKFSQE